ncbi:hypothetical protein V8C86DRAFT_1564403 [Haematococcus lacustris]
MRAKALLSYLAIFAAGLWVEGAATTSRTPSRRELKQSASSGGLNQRAQEAGGRTLSEVKRVVSELCNSGSGVDGASASLAAAVATATGQAYAQAATSQPSSAAGCGNVNEDARVLADAVAQALSSSFAGITNNCQAVRDCVAAVGTILLELCCVVNRLQHNHGHRLVSWGDANRA